MAGHARERAPGVWELRAYAGRDPLTGAKKYLTKTIRAKGKQEAQRQADAFAVEIRDEPVSSDMTFGELLEKWFEMAGPRMVPKGQKETRWMIDRRLKPLHDRKLSVLGAATGTAVLDEFYAALRSRGGVCRARKAQCPRESYPCDHGGGEPLADSTVIRTHVVVRAALEQAVKWGVIRRNPAEHAFAGEVEEDEIDPPSPGDVVRIFELAEAEDPELVVFLILASTTGQRRGRVGALQWDDLDLVDGVAEFRFVLSEGTGGVQRIKIGQRRRNKKGKKVVVPLDPSVTAILLAHRARCEARCELAGVELAADGYVFAADGIGSRPWDPGTITRKFARLRSAAGLDETRLHDLRHFVVSYLMASGVDLAVVRDLVGHSAGSETTLKRYAHALKENKRAATGILAKLLELDTPPASPPPDDDRPDAKIIEFRRRSG